MTQTQNIKPERITKPIQLLAAWLGGLVLLNSGFLFAATALDNATWERGLLVTASVLNVPLFIFAIFLLQTKFRPEMQEDSFYSKYLESKTGEVKRPASTNELSKLRDELYGTHRESLGLIAAVQEEIKNLSVIVDNGKGHVIPGEGASNVELKLITAAEASAWNQYEIRVNRLMPTLAQFKKALAIANIPVHGSFGNEKISLSMPPQVVIGDGFEMKHIKQFLNAIAHLEIGVVAFAYPESEDETYEREILIGAYNDHDYGLSLEDSLEVANADGIEISVFYSAIGR